MITTSNIIEKKKVGIVILVGNAARLVIKAIPIAAIAKAKNNMLFPVYITTNNVSGAKKHACEANTTPNHRSLLSS